MPKVSKVRVASSRPGDAPPPKPVLDKHICTRCGQIFKRQRGNFSASSSPLFKGNGGWLPICCRCVDDLYDHYKSVFSDEKKAMRTMCMKLDIYWSDDIYDMVYKGNTTNSRVRSYISKTNLLKYVGKTYDDTIDEEQAPVPVNYIMEPVDSSADSPVEFGSIPSPTPDILDFWGPGFTPDVYYDLDRRYKKWTANKGDIDESSTALYKQICLCEVTIAKNIMAGKPIEAAQRSMNELLGSLNAKPIQKKQEEKQDEAADAPFDSLPFGVGIKIFENARPIPKPDPRFDDVDGVVRYISTWLLGHLSKMVGLKNSYSKLYEKEMARLKMERPELNEEDDEDAFNDIFVEGTHENDS